MPVLMHISDLHRSSDDPISNVELVSALGRDLERQSRENPVISPPDALIVSGDLVAGAGLDEEDPDATIYNQYDEVEEFLGTLTNLLFDGDRSKIIICPGNHDIDWNQARRSMDRVPDQEIPKDVRLALAAPNSTLRWNWQDLSLYRITDLQVYRQRMDKYWDFIERFYSGANILRMPSRSDEPLLVELFGRRVLVAGFNSCETIDCFSRRPEIKPGTVEQLIREIEYDWEYDLSIAVWHHNTMGPPTADDYMHYNQVYRLIECGFSLGLHGHQHRHDIFLHSLGIPELGNMAIIGAGSLAAGKHELPRGTNRQYNMIELSDDLWGARLHLREVEVGTSFGPRRLNAFGGNSYSDISWLDSTEANPLIQDKHFLNRNTTIERSEAAIMSGDNEVAIAALVPIVGDLDLYGRELLANAALNSRQWGILIDQLSPPKYIREVPSLVRAAVALKEYELARMIVVEHGEALGMPYPERDNLIQWINGEELVHE